MILEVGSQKYVDKNGKSIKYNIGCVPLEILSIQRRLQMTRNYIILTHTAPDIDALCATWLLKNFGNDEKYPGIEKAALVTLGSNEEIENFIRKHEESDPDIVVIPVDIGGGKYDHHPHSAFPDDCAATLIAKDLGIEDDPALEDLLRYVLNTDTKPGDHPMALGNLVKRLNDAGNYPGSVQSWTEQAIDSIYTIQKRFWDAVKNEFEKTSRIEEINFGPHKVKLVVSQSDNDQIAKIARAKKVGVNAAVIIQKNSNGHIQVYINQRFGIISREIARLLRLEELKTKDFQIQDWKYLEKPGTLPEIPEWFYDENSENIYNGSKTHPHIPITKVSLEKIVELVKFALDYTKLHDKCPVNSCIKNQCPWYSLGLIRCRKIRYAEKHVVPL